MNQFAIFLVLLCIASSAPAQHKAPIRSNRPSAKTVTAVERKAGIDKGTVEGRTYSNKTFGFSVTFPDSWLIPGDDFEGYMKKQGFDLSLTAPQNLTPAARAVVNRALKNVSILLTAYRSMPGTADNAIVRISVEDLHGQPQIKDAVDYCDAVRASYKSINLPMDFKYSETAAEALGSKQFAFLDTSNASGKKRLYVTVRGGFAILFTLSYAGGDDLETIRKILADGNFQYR